MSTAHSSRSINLSDQRKPSSDYVQPGGCPFKSRQERRNGNPTSKVRPRVNIQSMEDIEKYLETFSLQDPIYEGYGCKDTSKSRSFERFRRRYFILFEGLLLYYEHKSQYNRDKKNGLVSL